MNNDEEKINRAVALSYNEKNVAPKVIAKGAGYIADKIIAVAKQNAVPVYQNKTLASMLMAVDIDREIPPELYKAVAEILAYVYRVDQNFRKLPK